MFTKYAITVIETVSTRDGARSRTAKKAYFEKLSSYNGYLHSSSTVTTTFRQPRSCRRLHRRVACQPLW